MTYNLSENYLKNITFIIFLLVFVFVINKPIELFPDSEGYLNMYIFRSATYPLFLSLIKTIFGSLFNIATIFIQILIGIYSIYFFVNTLKKNININPIWCLGLTIILLIPYIYNHNVANRFLSEALSYPLYLIVVTHYISLLITEKTKYILYAFPILFLLLMTRSQFIFMIPVGILILIWVSFKNKVFKQNIWLFLVLFCFPFLVSTADKTYHKIKHGHFVNTPWTGIHLITPAFYVANKEDASIFNTSEERLFFETTYKQLSEKKLNINHLNLKRNTDEITPFITYYSEIANHTVLTVGENLSDTKLTKNKKYITVDELTKNMTIPLILNNFKRWFNIYIKNIIHAFGNSKYVLLYLILFAYSLFGLKKNDSSKNKLIALIILLTFSNIALVAIGMHTIKRFTFYNDWVLFLIIFVLLDTINSFNKKPHGY
ncbi:MAG: hypothetical protein KAJ28_09130 [Flavobacteriaceae bacterium]|nr:hypothetical protein [Flavobacteriaceae bacterium]